MRPPAGSALDVPGRTPECVLERGDVVHFRHDDPVDPDRFEHRRDVSGDDRIIWLGPPILARIAEIGRHRRHVRGAGILQRAAKEQQPAKLVVAALVVVPIQRMQHEDVVAADILERTSLVLAILEAALLVRRKRDFQPTRHTLGKLPAALQTE